MPNGSKNKNASVVCSCKCNGLRPSKGHLEQKNVDRLGLVCQVCAPLVSDLHGLT
jgi:hypothetical protein